MPKAKIKPAAKFGYTTNLNRHTTKSNATKPVGKIARSQLGYTIKQLSEKLNRPEQTVWNWINNKKLKAHKDGLKWFIPMSEDEAIELLNNSKRVNRKKRKTNINVKNKSINQSFSPITIPNLGTVKAATNSEIKIEVPVALVSFCADFNIDLNALIQKNTDELCKTMIDKMSQCWLQNL